MTVKCSRCGKFCKPYDSGIRYCATCLREPDPDYFCKSCVKEMKAHPEEQITNVWYIKPKYILEIEKQRKTEEK